MWKSDGTHLCQVPVWKNLEIWQEAGILNRLPVPVLIPFPTKEYILPQGCVLDPSWESQMVPSTALVHLPVC